MKARIVRIGNSRGIRIPKPLLEQAGLEEEVVLRVEGGSLIVESAVEVRAGWAEAAQELAAAGGTGLLDEPVPTRFDAEEWEW
ncbi:MAG: AbrB/MazE/SpoVT family DNA-binding domain-containing protein [Gemmatimonadota bacterium]|nr:AbrB/MazE/SpoVT family DNA-binding domain-containing protein [Gemmatimonadota bacterium]